MAKNPIYDQPGKSKDKASKAASQAPVDPNQIPHFFNLVAAMAVFTKDGEAKTRFVNIMLETDSPNIRRPDLDQANHGILSRLVTENGIEADDLQDIVILGITRLGHMPQPTFYGISAEELAELQAQQMSTEAAA